MVDRARHRSRRAWSPPTRFGLGTVLQVTLERNGSVFVLAYVDDLVLAAKTDSEIAFIIQTAITLDNEGNGRDEVYPWS